MKLEFSQQIFEKFSNIKFRENPSSVSQAVPCGRPDKMKVIATFHNFAKAPNTPYVLTMKKKVV
jgi:hypothetical protein